MADNDEDALKRQFEQLQLQQQQKLQKRKEKKQKKQQDDESKAAALEAEKTTASAFGVDDELDLKTEDPLPKSASYLSTELVEHLNEQIGELKDENGRLFKLLSERDYEIRQLKKKREEDKMALAGSSSLSSDTAAAKIVELSKKVRELNASLETKKTEAKQLFGRCRHLENELASKDDKTTPRLNTVTHPDDVSPRSRALNESEFKQVTDKLRISEQRNAEYRNQVQGLKTEIKMAQKVIANEIGEGVNFHDLLNANSNWRGRAQQILGLQKKVGELKQQLEHQPPIQSSRDSGGRNPDAELEAEFMGAKQSKGADMKHREALRRLEKEKKESQERATAELKALEGDYNSLKQRLDASKARNKVLANENKSFKAEMQKLVDKGTHDDELISALIAQQANMKTMIEQLTQLQKENQLTQQDKMEAITAKNQQENNIISQLKQIVSEKEGKVKQLEQELVQLKQAKIQESQMNSVNALFDRPATQQSARSARSERPDSSANTQPPPPAADIIQTNPAPLFPSYDDDADTDEDEVTTSKTAEPPRASSRHGSAKVKSGKQINGTQRPTSNSGRRSGGNGDTWRLKSSSRPNTGSKTQMSKAEKDAYEAQLQEHKSLAQAAQVERDKLMELLQVTQKRLDEANEQTMLYQNEMKAHKQNAVQLEKIIGKMRLEGSQAKSTSGVSRKREKTNVSGNFSLGSMTDLRGAGGAAERVDELETSLALQRDENEALKAALESTLQAKEEDLKLYNEMIEQTKLVFLQGLRQIKTQNQPS